MINAILACDDYGGIGKNNTLPWPHNNQDLQWFKQNTQNGIVVMGAKTWASEGMPKPLPLRHNIVVTLHPENYPGAHEYITKNICEEIKLINSSSDKQIWIIGGGKLIEQTLPIIDNFYLSRISGNYHCDAFIPLDKIKKLFQRVYIEHHDTVTFEIWKK